MKYCELIGRWQCLEHHQGHYDLIHLVKRKADSLGLKVLISIRDVEINEKNPYLPETIKSYLENKFPFARVEIKPDIEGIYYGRGVGYNIECLESEISEETKKISATNIRNELKTKEKE